MPLSTKTLKPLRLLELHILQGAKMEMDFFVLVRGLPRGMSIREEPMENAGGGADCSDMAANDNTQRGVCRARETGNEILSLVRYPVIVTRNTYINVLLLTTSGVEDGRYRVKIESRTACRGRLGIWESVGEYLNLHPSTSVSFSPPGAPRTNDCFSVIPVVPSPLSAVVRAVL